MNIIKFSYDINLKLSEHLSTTLCICSLPWLLTVSSTVCLYRFQSNPSLQPRWPPFPLLLWDLNFFWLRQWAPSTRSLFHSNMGDSWFKTYLSTIQARSIRIPSNWSWSKSRHWSSQKRCLGLSLFSMSSNPSVMLWAQPQPMVKIPAVKSERPIKAFLHRSWLVFWFTLYFFG